MPIIPEYAHQMQLQVPGGAPSAQPPREPDIAGHDLQQAGREVMSGVEALQHAEAQKNNLFVAQTASRLAIDENKAYLDAQNKAGPDATDFAKNHEADIRKRVQDAAAAAPNQRAAQELLQHVQPWITSRVDVAQHWEVGTQRFATSKGLEQSMNDGANAVFTADEPGRDLAARNVVAQQSLAIDKSALTPEEKYHAKQSLLSSVARAGVLGDIRDNPQAATDYLLNHKSPASAPAGYLRSLRESGPPDMEGYISAVGQAESGGHAIGYHGGGTTAYGAYGFTKGTWSALSAAHPELNLKPEDRFSDVMQHKAMQAKVADDSEYLAGAGFPASYTNLYMAHFLGPAGAKQFLTGLQGNPDVDARTLVSRDAAVHNPDVFNGRTAGEVYMLYAHKFGNAEENPKPNAPEYYKILTASERESLYQNAHSAAQHKNTLAEAAFGQQATDTLSKAATLGTNSPLTQGQFVETYGPERGAALYNDYQVNHAAALTSYQLNGKTPSEAAQLVDSLKPHEDTPNYDTRYKIWEQLATQHARNEAALLKDSPAYLSDPSRPQNKVVADAFDAMRKGMTPETTAAYAGALDSEQARMGIPPAQRTLLPAAYAADIARQIEGKTKGAENDPNAALAALTAYKQVWGPLWGRIYPELKDKLSPVVEVATSGIDPHIAAMLLGVANKSPEQLEKDTLPVDERKTLSDKTIANFEELARSMGADLQGVNSVGIYAEQARKLAVMFRTQGMGVSDAAEKAYKVLIGYRYVFSDNVRVPKEEYFRGFERELRDAKTRLPPLLRGATQKVVNPFTNEPVERLPQSFADERQDSYVQRNAVWMTEPGNQGVWLTVDGQRVLRADSTPQNPKPVFFSWGDLKTAKAGREGAEQKTREAEAAAPTLEDLGNGR